MKFFLWCAGVMFWMIVGLLALAYIIPKILYGSRKGESNSQGAIGKPVVPFSFGGIYGLCKNCTFDKGRY